MDELPNQELPDSAPQQEPELGKQALGHESDSAKKLALRAKRLGVVNAVLCGMLAVASVIFSVLANLPLGDAEGLVYGAISLFCIPVALIPIGISCLIGVLRSRAVMRRHPSREARLGLRLSLGGPIAVILCYVLGWGIPILYPGLSMRLEPHMAVDEVRLTEGWGDLSAPAWSPDGSRIAFAGDGQDDRHHLYVMDADGSNVVCLTDGSADARAPAWSPDGTRIAFESNRAGQYDWDIYVMDADGSNEVRLTQDGVDPDWSPDGSRIAFASGMYGGQVICVMDADGSNVVRLTDGNGETNPAWSPDGSRIAFEGYGRVGYPHIYVTDADGSDIVQLTHGLIEGDPAWSPDGSRIAFTGYGQDDRDHIYVMDADGVNVLRLTDGSGGEWGPTWSPDGSRIAYSCSHDFRSDICVIEVDE